MYILLWQAVYISLLLKLKQSVDLRSYVESAFTAWSSALSDIEWPDLLTSASKERGCLKVTP